MPVVGCFTCLRQLLVWLVANFPLPSHTEAVALAEVPARWTLAQSQRVSARPTSARSQQQHSPRRESGSSPRTGQCGHSSAAPASAASSSCQPQGSAATAPNTPLLPKANEWHCGCLLGWSHAQPQHECASRVIIGGLTWPWLKELVSLLFLFNAILLNILT